jgi:hypothetical protein
MLVQESVQNHLQSSVQNFVRSLVQMVVQKKMAAMRKRLAEMNCRNRAEFYAEVYAQKMRRCRCICRRNAEQGLEAVRI